MKKLFYGTLAAAFLLASCTSGFKKGEGGTQYKIVASGKGDKLKSGTFIEFSFKQMYKDSVLFSSADYANQVAPFDSASMPKDIFNIFSQCRMGDSVIIKILTDSAFKGQPIQLPFKKGQYFLTSYKIVNVYSQRAQADSAMKVQNSIAEGKMKAKEQLQAATDDKIITEYLAKNNIKATKTALGTYVEIITPGTGPLIDTSVAVKVKYTGRTLAGKMFDSNTDPSAASKEPYPVMMWQPEVITGWVDGLSTLSKGAKARFFVPSGRAYGPRGSGKDIAPNTVLMFDIEVPEVQSKAAAIAERAAIQKKQEQEYMAMQKKYEDSVKLAAKADSLVKKK